MVSLDYFHFHRLNLHPHLNSQHVNVPSKPTPFDSILDLRVIHLSSDLHSPP